MVYKVEIPSDGPDRKYCYTPNCRLHSAAWATAVPAVDDRAALMKDFGLVEPQGRRNDPRESGKDVLNGIPKKDRVQITAEQLDGVFEIMKQFGTREDDSWGFRRYIAKKDSFYEWSERGADIRYIQHVRSDGELYSVDLYRISGTTEDEVKVLRGQAAIRHTLGLEEYTYAERQRIAEDYWTAALLPTLGNMPGDGARLLRRNYINEITRRPELIPEVLDAWEKTPRAKIQDTIGSGRTFIDVIAPGDDPYNGHVRTKLLAAIDKGDKKEFNRVFKDHGKNLPRRTYTSVANWAKKMTAEQFAEAAAQNA